MKIIIDISKELYTNILATWKDIHPQMHSILKNGTPLPKGHGRLVDADALASEIKGLKKSPWYKDNTNLAYLPRKEAVEIIEEIIVGDAPTIIEADKEVEDNEDS